MTPMSGGQAVTQLDALAWTPVRRCLDTRSLSTAQLPQSPEPVCNWFQQRLEFDDVPNVNTIIDETLNIFKDRAREI